MSKKKFYLKKLQSIGEITVWLVDGNRIRRQLDMDFTNFGQHFVFPFIPEDEFWLDPEALVLKEKDFFLTHLLVEWEMMKQGYDYITATNAADQKERVDRAKAGDLKKVLKKDGEIDLKKIHQRLLKRLPNGFKIWLVNGRLVRSAWDPEFTAGSHHQVDPYVPEDEIWIDSAVSQAEKLFVILHELYENDLMIKEHLDYDPAHDRANAIEQRCRRNSKHLAGNLRKFGWVVSPEKSESVTSAIGLEPKEAEAVV